MAITSNVHQFGTQDTVSAGGGTSAVAAGSKSVQADVIPWTNDDDAPEASFVLGGATYATAPSAYATVSLFARLLNVDSTNDSEQPDANYDGIWLGDFKLNDVTTAQYPTVDAKLPNAGASQEYEFYIRNNDATQSMSAGWTLKVTPRSRG